MINIMLACSMGMSTNMMAESMERAAASRGIEAHIWAVPESKTAENIGDADVILLGPQLSFKLDSLRKQFPDALMECIDMRIYGLMDGNAGLNQALAMLKQRGKPDARTNGFQPADLESR